MNISLVHGDITNDVLIAARRAGRIAWDIETTGLSCADDAIATCQIDVPGLGSTLVQIDQQKVPVNLRNLLADASVLKVFHHAPFDLSFMEKKWSVEARQVACTKVASKLLYDGVPNSAHSLQSLLHNELGIQIDKGERLSNWMDASLTPAQVKYAVNDVRHLLNLYDSLVTKLEACGKEDIYRRCCSFLPAFVELRIAGKEEIFSY